MKVIISNGKSEFSLDEAVWLSVLTLAGLPVVPGAASLSAQQAASGAAELRAILLSIEKLKRLARAQGLLSETYCALCGGSGVRCDYVGNAKGFNDKLISDDTHPRFGQVGWCNGCDGTGVKDEDEGVLNIYHLSQFLRRIASFMSRGGELKVQRMT
jgi:hypothetical protein